MTIGYNWSRDQNRKPDLSLMLLSSTLFLESFCRVWHKKKITVEFNRSFFFAWENNISKKTNQAQKLIKESNTIIV